MVVFLFHLSLVTELKGVLPYIKYFYLPYMLLSVCWFYYTSAPIEDLLIMLLVCLLVSWVAITYQATYKESNDNTETQGNIDVSDNTNNTHKDGSVFSIMYFSLRFIAEVGL